MSWLNKILAVLAAILGAALLILRRQLSDAQAKETLAKDNLETQEIKIQAKDLEEKVASDDKATEKALSDYLGSGTTNPNPPLRKRDGS